MQMDLHNCEICGKLLTDDVGYFEVLNTSELTPDTTCKLCEDCAKITTVYDLYYRGKIGMYNSPDDVIEVDAVVDGGEIVTDGKAVENSHFF